MTDLMILAGNTAPELPELPELHGTETGIFLPAPQMGAAFNPLCAQCLRNVLHRIVRTAFPAHENVQRGKPVFGPRVYRDVRLTKQHHARYAMLAAEMPEVRAKHRGIRMTCRCDEQHLQHIHITQPRGIHAVNIREHMRANGTYCRCGRWR